jgi:hypothetical protein
MQFRWFGSGERRRGEILRSSGRARRQPIRRVLVRWEPIRRQPIRRVLVRWKPIRRTLVRRELADGVARRHEIAPRGTDAWPLETERFDATRHVRQRTQQAHQLHDLFLGPELGAEEHFDDVRFREVRAEQQERGEMELAAFDRTEERRETLHEPRRGNAAKCSVFRHAELVNAIRKEACAGSCAVQAARFDLGQVCKQRREHSVRLTDEPPRPREQLCVRQRADGVDSHRVVRVGRRTLIHVTLTTQSLFVGVHVRTLHPDFLRL